MIAVFADTFYFIALLNVDDETHDLADEFSGDPLLRVVTTAWVLTELADGLAKTGGRTIFQQLFEALAGDARVEIVPPETELWRRGMDLYNARPDKGWSLTDCISFVVMNDRGISDALTGDHHFEQAGFNALMKVP